MSPHQREHRSHGEAVAPIAVIGIGNVLLGDDGFGPTVLEILAAGWVLPDTVELIDAGTPGLDLAGLLCGREAVLFVDAVAAPEAPGTLLQYRDQQIAEALTLQVRVSPHDPALAEALAIARLVDGGPERVLLVGAVPQSVEVGLGLSEAVKAASAEAAAIVANALAGWGAAPHRRTDAVASSPWWSGEGDG